MLLTIDKYRDILRLGKYFQPGKASLLEGNKEQIVNRLLKEFGIKNTIASYVKKRNLLEKLLVELSPDFELSPNFLRLLDTLLQVELRQKQLTDAKFLSSIKECPNKEFSKVVVWKGDITTLKIDAIVNAANNQLLGCFVPFHRCIDNAIHCAAGPRLRKDCHTIISLQGELEPTGHAKVTRAYNLPSRYVIHTVGPIVRGKLTQLNKIDLRNSYLSCLELSKKLERVRSIAFCSIATGIYGFPFEEAAKIAVDAVNGWMADNPDRLDYLVFNVFKDSEKVIYKKIIRS